MKITMQEQKNITDIFNDYSKADSRNIRSNLSYYIKRTNKTSEDLAKELNLSKHTIYAITKTDNKNKPDFMTTLRICNHLNLEIKNIIS